MANNTTFVLEPFACRGAEDALTVSATVPYRNQQCFLLLLEAGVLLVYILALTPCICPRNNKVNRPLMSLLFVPVLVLLLLIDAEYIILNTIFSHEVIAVCYTVQGVFILFIPTATIDNKYKQALEDYDPVRVPRGTRCGESARLNVLASVIMFSILIGIAVPVLVCVYVFRSGDVSTNLLIYSTGLVFLGVCVNIAIVVLISITIHLDALCVCACHMPRKRAGILLFIAVCIVFGMLLSLYSMALWTGFRPAYIVTDDCYQVQFVGAWEKPDAHGRVYASLTSLATVVAGILVWLSMSGQSSATTAAAAKGDAL